MADIVSPLTNAVGVNLITEIPVTIIEDIYNKNLGINVKRFFSTDNVRIYECSLTGFRFYYPLDIAGDDKLYEELQKHAGYYSTWNWEHDVVYQLVKPGYKVLEVGCGTGSFIERLSKEGFEVFGLELNNEAVKVCTGKGLNVYHEFLEEHTQYHREKYDLVCSFQVLEHVVNPRSFILECMEAVKPGGKIIFGVPNNNPYLFKRDKYHTLNLPPHHMGLWSVKAFKKLPEFFKIKTNQVLTEPLYNKEYYFNVLLGQVKIPIVKSILKRCPSFVIKIMSVIGRWKGRNLVAIFAKL